MYLVAAQPQKAAAQLQAILQIQPDDRNAKYLLATALGQEGKKPEAKNVNWLIEDILNRRGKLHVEISFSGLNLSNGRFNGCRGLRDIRLPCTSRSC